MDTLKEYIKSAIKNIRANRLRTMLTMLGIVIGISSVVTIIIVGNGMSKYVEDQFLSIGSNAIDIQINSTKTDKVFTADDMKAVEEQFDGVLGTSFYFAADGTITGRNGNFDVEVDGGTSDYHLGESNGILYGRYFTDEEVISGSKVCVIMESDAKKLCGTKNAVGMTVTVEVKGHVDDYEIVGVNNDYSELLMKILEIGGIPMFLQVPYTAAGDSSFYDISQPTLMKVYCKWADESVKPDVIIRYLENVKGIRGLKAMSYYDGNSDINDIKDVMGLVTVFMSFVAAISLLVGGIGVMNIMLVSVTERTREIGIRKAIGARTASIMVQFVAESAIITLLGGVIGIVIGFGLAAVACNAVHFDYIVTLTPVIVATGVSMFIGLFFGVYPAKKAAKLKPIDALNRRN